MSKQAFLLYTYLNFLEFNHKNFQHGRVLAYMSNPSPQADVFAVHGVAPELLAYAMAKYSRSSLSLKQALAEMSAQKAESFLNTFYFQYGHKSIADMAHVPLGIENISLLAAIEVVDESKWDGQERSTRYQDFSKPKYYTPDDLDSAEAELYHGHTAILFDGYHKLFKATVDVYRQQHPRPDGMEEAAYERTLRARAFDVARYLLPLSTLTSVGQVTNARVLEAQISRLRSSPMPEVRAIGEKMMVAAISSAYDPDSPFTNLVCPAPTLIKHAEANEHKARVAEVVLRYLSEARFLPPVEVTHPYVMSYSSDARDFENEILSTLVYEHAPYTFGHCVEMVESMSPAWRSGFLRDVLAVRGKHDELLRSFKSGAGFIFDIQMDIGGMRDMHRHRRCIQIAQPYTASSFAPPEVPGLANSLCAPLYEKTQEAHWRMRLSRMRRGESRPGPEQYLLPLGTMCRFLMKMDLAEAAYISELRTGPAGHISYRRVAYSIFKTLEAVCPTVAAGIKDRVTDPDSPLDFFKR